MSEAEPPTLHIWLRRNWLKVWPNSRNLWLSRPNRSMLHSADQIAIVIEGASVTSTATQGAWQSENSITIERGHTRISTNQGFVCTMHSLQCNCARSWARPAGTKVRGSIPEDKRKAYTLSCFAMSAKYTGNHDLFLLTTVTTMTMTRDSD